MAKRALSPRETTTALLAALTLCIILHNLWLLLQRCPLDYAWSELLINYQGGFLRRGLLGATAYALRVSVSPCLSVTAIMTAAALAFWWLSRALWRRMDLAARLFSVCSPGLFAFWAWDYDAFARKELFGMVCFAALTLAVTRRHENAGGKPLGAPACLLLCVALAILALVHEGILFFLPFYVLVLRMGFAEVARGKRLGWSLAALSAPGLAVCLSLRHAGNASTALAIAASWHDAFPGIVFSPLVGALWFLPLSLGQALAASRTILFAFPTNACYLALFAICLLPAAYMSLLARPGLSRLLRSGNADKLLLAGCALLPLCLFLIGTDFGRWIGQIGFYWFLFFLACLDRETLCGLRQGDLPPVALPGGHCLAYRTFAACGATLALASLGVGMLHFARAGQSPLLWLPVRGLLP